MLRLSWTVSFRKGQDRTGQDRTGRRIEIEQCVMWFIIHISRRIMFVVNICNHETTSYSIEMMKIVIESICQESDNFYTLRFLLCGVENRYSSQSRFLKYSSKAGTDTTITNYERK